MITITSKPGTRDPKVPNAKIRHQVAADPGFKYPPEIMVDTPLELEPSNLLKGYAVITIFVTRGIVIHIAHEYSLTFQVSDFF